MKRIKSLAIIILLGISLQSYGQSPCSSDVFRAFDFWIGNWKVETPDGKFAGYNNIQVILDSCVIMENWTGAGKSVGKSFNHYDWQSKTWKQKWVDNFASNLEFSGTVANDTARYSCQSKNPQTGALVYNKMMIARVNENEVHQLWEQSTDNKKWGIVFDGKYTRISDQNERDISSVYSIFSTCYATGNDTLLANQYTEDALYLSGDGAMMQGRDRILANFKNFFGQINSRNQDAKIEFKIINRKIEETIAYDIGYYYLVYTDKTTKRVTNESVGKFITTFEKGKGGKWRFSSDSYNTAPLEAYKNAEPYK